MGFFAMVLVVLVYAANFDAVRYSVQHGLNSFDLAALRFSAAGLLVGLVLVTQTAFTGTAGQLVGVAVVFAGTVNAAITYSLVKTTGADLR